MQVYYVRFPGHLNFGAWRDEMQAQAWIVDLGNRYRQLTQIAARGEPDEMPEELAGMLRDFRDEIFGYADEQTKRSLRKDPNEAFLVLMYCHEEFVSSETGPKIDGFEIKDAYYQENLRLENRFRKFVPR